MTDELRIIESAHKVATVSARIYGMSHMADDIKSDILEQYSRHLKSFNVLADNDEFDLIEYRFMQTAYAVCHKEAVRQDRFTGSNFYSPKYVRLFAMFLFAYTDWSNGPEPEISGEWSTGEAVDTAIDLKAAFPGLKPEDQAIILARHVDPPKAEAGGACWATIGERTGRGSAQAAERAYRRATEQWARLANRSRDDRATDHDGTGARRPLTAAQGRNLVSTP